MYAMLPTTRIQSLHSRGKPEQTTFTGQKVRVLLSQDNLSTLHLWIFVQYKSLAACLGHKLTGICTYKHYYENIIAFCQPQYRVSDVDVHEVVVQ